MNFVPIAIALRPRKLIAALPSARAIFAPSPGLSPPSILTQWIVSVFARPASCAARVAFAPLTGLTNRIPLPGCSGVRRANTSSRSAPALASASSLSAAPPARSTSIADQTSAFATLSAMVFPLSGMQPANLLPRGQLWLASAQVAVGQFPVSPLSGSVYNRFSQAYLRLLIGEIGGNSTKRPFRLPLDIATRLEKCGSSPSILPDRYRIWRLHRA